MCANYGTSSFLSVPLALGIAPILLLKLWSIDALSHSSSVPLWTTFSGLFVLAWIGQFVGHAIEGKRPSFFKDTHGFAKSALLLRNQCGGQRSIRNHTSGECHLSSGKAVNVNSGASTNGTSELTAPPPTGLPPNTVISL
jgi:hypothetical protein